MIAKRAGGALVAVVVAAAAMVAGRAWIRDVVTDGGAGVEQRALAGAGRSAMPVERRPVRVVILDGLRRDEARGFELERICAAGMDLTIDVGFPTKSLPVQSVLWTGLTAPQSGIAMRNELPRPIAGALPAKLAGARAVVEAWPSIARAVGFDPETPPPPGFAEAAEDAVESDAPLVLIHVLAIDEAGHRAGVGAAYRAEVSAADILVGGLFDRAPGAAWIILSDHGHLARGGHGDVEPEVRHVRGCVTPRPPGAPASGDVHLVDVSRHLHDTLGVALPARAVGRPLAVAAASPDRDATLPRPGTLAWLAALVVWLAGVALTWRFGRTARRGGGDDGRRAVQRRDAVATVLAALAPVLCALAYVAIHGVPSLSWRSPGTALALGAVAGTGVFFSPGRGHPGRVIGLTVPSVSVGVAAAIVAGLPAALVGGAPPRLPHVTAAWQLVVVSSAVPLLLAAGLAGWLLSGPRTSEVRTEPSGGSDQGVRDPDGR